VPFLVAAMAFLAALAIAGWAGAVVLADRLETGAGSTLTVQVPRTADPTVSDQAARLTAVQAVLSATPGVEDSKVLPDKQLNAMLRPWLGGDIQDLAMPIPAVIAVHMSASPANLGALADKLAGAAPGTTIDDHEVWAGRLRDLAGGLQLIASLVVLIVTAVTIVVIAVVTRSGLAARRESIVILYQLGATDGYIARRFANRSAVLAMIGGAIGGVCALPVVLAVATIAAPLVGGPDLTLSLSDTFFQLDWLMWLLPVLLLLSASFIGYLTTQFMMRRWLRRLT
jgi:cell division transport system permease protein